VATVIASVTDCRSFWREIVVPDHNDSAAVDARRAGAAACRRHGPTDAISRITCGQCRPIAGSDELEHDLSGVRARAVLGDSPAASREHRVPRAP
jgi:hypothetical protein